MIKFRKKLLAVLLTAAMLISMSSDETGFWAISDTIEAILSFADLDKV